MGDLDIDGKIMLKWILRKSGVKVWAECMWLIIGTGATLRALCLTVEFSLFCSYRNFYVGYHLVHLLKIWLLNF